MHQMGRGASNDLNVQQIARDMVTRYGMTDESGEGLCENEAKCPRPSR